MYFQEDEYILGGLCRLSPWQQGEHIEQWQQKLIGYSWPRCVRAATRHQLGPLLQEQLQSHAPRKEQCTRQWGPQPPAQSKALNQQARQSWMQAMIRERLLRQMGAAFSSQQIPAMLYKGVSYLNTLYQAPSLRMMEDIDLLLPLDAKPHCHKIFLDIGFQQKPLEHPCADLYWHPQQRLFLDAHYAITRPGLGEIPADELFQLATQDTQSGWYQPSRLTMYLLHIHHQCKEQLLPTFIKFRSFIELRELYLQIQHEWQEAQQLAAKWKLTGFVESSLHCLEDLYPGLLLPQHHAELAPPAPWLAWVREPCDADTAQSIKKVLQRGAFLLGNLASWQERYTYVRNRLRSPLYAIERWKRHPHQKAKPT